MQVLVLRGSMLMQRIWHEEDRRYKCIFLGKKDKIMAQIKTWVCGPPAPGMRYGCEGAGGKVEPNWPVAASC